MSRLRLVFSLLLSRPLNAALCVVAVATGIAILSLLLLVGGGIASGFARNAEGIDIVVGAKGSALQLVLSSVYHLDVPAGNIEMAEFDKLKTLRQVRRAIPLALGDNYRGFRIVGSTPDYLDLYGATVDDGTIFSAPFEAVAGAATGLTAGQEFAGAHGFSADSDDVHDFHLYKIVGVLKPTGTVIDRLIVTPYQSVQELHAPHEDHDGHGHHHDENEDPEEAAAEEAAHQVTAVLLTVKSPLATLNLPRALNRDSGVQAAVPAYEMTRLARSLGLGRTMLFAAGGIIVAVSALLMLAALSANLAARRYDLAVMRVLGAEATTLSAIVMTEALLLSAAGVMVGLCAGHGLAYLLSSEDAGLNGLILPAEMLKPSIQDLWLASMGLTAGVFAAALPATMAYRADIAAILSGGSR